MLEDGVLKRADVIGKSYERGIGDCGEVAKREPKAQRERNNEPDDERQKRGNNKGPASNA